MTTASVNILGKRIESIDLLRGLVMVIMALDHTRDFFFLGSLSGDPTDLATTTTPLFFTRWITHFCAPIFVMLSGASAFLYGYKKGRKELSFFLLTRGIWLIFLEITFVRFGWTFNIYLDSIFMFQVIWAIGCSMVILSALIWLHKHVVLAIGLLIVFFHNRLDQILFTPEDALYIPWAFLHEPTFLQIKSASAFTLYPVIPWLGVMACGFALGQLYVADFSAIKRRNILLLAGLTSIVIFIALRAYNQYGNPEPWVGQKSALFTFLSFINTQKYPPSLLFLTMTLGPALLFLPLAEKISGWVAKFFITIGRVPLFYYLMHIYLIHASALALFFITGHTWDEIDYTNSPLGFPVTYGFTLFWVYVAWISIVLVLYPLCKWYGNIKQKSTWKGWSYL